MTTELWATLIGAVVLLLTNTAEAGMKKLRDIAIIKIGGTFYHVV